MHRKYGGCCPKTVRVVQCKINVVPSMMMMKLRTMTNGLQNRRMFLHAVNGESANAEPVNDLHAGGRDRQTDRQTDRERLTETLYRWGRQTDRQRETD